MIVNDKELKKINKSFDLLSRKGALALFSKAFFGLGIYTLLVKMP